MQAKDASVFKIITANVSACQKCLNSPALCLKTWYCCLLSTAHLKAPASQICKHCWQCVMDEIAKFARCLSFHTADILRNGLRNSKPLWETVIPPKPQPNLEPPRAHQNLSLGCLSQLLPTQPLDPNCSLSIFSHHMVSSLPYTKSPYGKLVKWTVFILTARWAALCFASLA